MRNTVSISKEAVFAAIAAAGLSKAQFMEKHKIANQSFYGGLAKGKVTRDLAARIQAGLPGAKITNETNGHANGEAEAGHGNKVPSGFIRPAMEQLSMSYAEVAAVHGMPAASTLAMYVKNGFCPAWVRVAFNGLLAEHASGNGAKQIGAPVERVVRRRYDSAIHLIVDSSDVGHAVTLLAQNGIRVTIARE